MRHLPDNQIIRDHPLTKLVWEPLRRAMLGIRAGAPSKPRTEVVNEAASIIFEDHHWRNVLERELIRPRHYAPEDAFDWLCCLGQQIWPYRLWGDYRIEVRVTRHEISVEGVLPPTTERGNSYYEQNYIS